MAFPIRNRKVKLKLRKRSSRCAAGVAYFVVLAGCSFPFPQWGRTVELTVMCADPPPSWNSFGSMDELIVLPVPPGERPGFVKRVEAGVESFQVTIEKRSNFPILAFAALDGRRDLLKPAGAVYPFSLDNRGRLRLRYRDGFLAYLLFAIYASDNLLEAVNVSRLSEELWNRSEGDPWALDREAILQTMVYGSMRSTRIHRRASFDLEIAMEAGRWISDDPFVDVVVVPTSTPTVFLEGIPTGVHRYHHVGEKAGLHERIDLTVTQKGWMCVNEATGTSECGSW